MNCAPGYTGIPSIMSVGAASDFAAAGAGAADSGAGFAGGAGAGGGVVPGRGNGRGTGGCCCSAVARTSASSTIFGLYAACRTVVAARVLDGPEFFSHSWGSH